MCPFDYTVFAGSGKKVGLVNQDKHTSWVVVVSLQLTVPSRPFWWPFCIVILPFRHCCWYRGFCHRTVSDLFLFLLDFLHRPCLKFYFWHVISQLDTFLNEQDITRLQLFMLAIFCVVNGLLNFCWYRGFRHRTESDLALFLITNSFIYRGREITGLRVSCIINKMLYSCIIRIKQISKTISK